MKQETSIVARNYRLQEWALMIQECNNRPEGMTITQWCSEHNIKPVNYYYRLNEVRKACLDTLPAEVMQQQIVPVSRELLEKQAIASDCHKTGLEVSVNGVSIHVTETTSPELLKMVLGVVSNA
jgi:hypothetical protein